MFCSNCGTQIPDDSNFCPKCGKPQRNGLNTTSQEVRYERIVKIQQTVIKRKPDFFFFIGGATWIYVAIAVGSQGQYEAARSPEFIEEGSWLFFDSNSSHDRNKKAKEWAFDQLIRQLSVDGWESTGRDNFGEYTFRRRVR
ncbi:MAG: hypothetical protein BroJett018_10170 [Chloroflexota bacterium]|nr:zinc ribbon domain-containing protein [Chloroflexota bacterium]NOG62569.1 zinc ribbon domain-containing protein [Chloroflexota bacterium]GIK63223.1 MAG: hypothetical protein BroJett018_10170 [Chloroflexota bacterium]